MLLWELMCVTDWSMAESGTIILYRVLERDCMVLGLYKHALLLSISLYFSSTHKYSNQMIYNSMWRHFSELQFSGPVPDSLLIRRQPCIYDHAPPPLVLILPRQEGDKNYTLSACSQMAIAKQLPENRKWTLRGISAHFSTMSVDWRSLS